MRPTVIVLVVAALLVANADAWGGRWIRTASTVCLWHRGGGRETDRYRDRQTDRDREGQRQKQRQRDRQIERERERERERESV